MRLTTIHNESKQTHKNKTHHTNTQDQENPSEQHRPLWLNQVIPHKITDPSKQNHRNPRSHHKSTMQHMNTPIQTQINNYKSNPHFKNQIKIKHYSSHSLPSPSPSSVYIMHISSTSSNNLAPSIIRIRRTRMAFIIRNPWSRTRNHIPSKSFIAYIPLLHHQHSPTDLRFHFWLC